MDPNLALILTALTTGAQGVANEAAKDAYHGLKTLIQRKFKGQPDEQSAQVALSKYEEKPDVWQEPLKDALIEAQADQDQTIVVAAHDLLELIKAHQQPLTHSVINNTGTMQGTTIGDHNTVTTYFNAEPPHNSPT